MIVQEVIAAHLVLGFALLKLLDLGEAFHQREACKEKQREVQKAGGDYDADHDAANKDTQGIEAGQNNDIDRRFMFEPGRIERRRQDIERKKRGHHGVELPKTDGKGCGQKPARRKKPVFGRQNARCKRPVAFAFMLSVGFDVQKVIDDVDRRSAHGKHCHRQKRGAQHARVQVAVRKEQRQ